MTGGDRRCGIAGGEGQVQHDKVLMRGHNADEVQFEQHQLGRCRIAIKAGEKIVIGLNQGLGTSGQMGYENESEVRSNTKVYTRKFAHYEHESGLGLS